MTRRSGLAGLAVAMAALAASGCSNSSAAPSAGSTSSSPPATATTSDATPTPSPSALTPGARVGGSAGEVVTVGKQVWAQIDTELDRIDPGTGAIVRRVDVGDDARAGTTVVGHDVWVATQSGTAVVDTRVGRVVRHYKDVVIPDGQVGWAVRGAQVVRLSLPSGKVTGRASLGSVQPDDWTPILAVGDGAAWVGLGTRHDLVRIDATTLRPTHIKGFAAADCLMVVGVGYGSVWVQQNAVGAGRLYLVDPATSRIIRQVSLGKRDEAGRFGGTNLVFARNAVWTGDSSPTVTAVSSTGKVERVIDVPTAPQYLGITAGDIWLGADVESHTPGLTRVRMP
ncbi:MAG TPA: hypothetical protein VFH66_01315 [Mycobacteriales bacterium]|nr:hypothetical protein [Mycobacteriales bacterium]